jgi:peptidoglycan hydrolase CwlO-like protein
VKDLEQEKDSIESQISSLEKELDDILAKIKKKSTELKKTREELAIAKGKEEAQYESMMLRIKYMYENGNTNLLEILFSILAIGVLLSITPCDTVLS